MFERNSLPNKFINQAHNKNKWIFLDYSIEGFCVSSSDCNILNSFKWSQSYMISLENCYFISLNHFIKCSKKNFSSSSPIQTKQNSNHPVFITFGVQFVWEEKKKIHGKFVGKMFPLGWHTQNKKKFTTPFFECIKFPNFESRKIIKPKL
jgi:hypothetical protein